MVTEDLMRKYKYGYIHSCKLLEEKFIKDLLKENQELKKQYCERTDCSARLGTSKKVEALEKENEELKKQLKGTTHCFDEEEHERLKKQLHEASLTIQEMVEQNIWCPSSCDKLEKLTTQQKVFIKYLEDEIKLYENDIRNFSKDYKVYFSLINDLRVSRTKTEEILQKYKEIVNGTERS